MCRKTDVIARRAKPDVAIPCKFPECIVLWSCADLWRGLPRQCAHWLAMTCVVRYSPINYDFHIFEWKKSIDKTFLWRYDIKVVSYG